MQLFKFYKILKLKYHKSCTIIFWCHILHFYHYPLSVASPTQPPDVPGSCPSSQWVPYGSSCYAIMNFRKSYSRAQRDCKSKGGALTSIHDASIGLFLGNMLANGKRNYNAWIGMVKKSECILYIVNYINHTTVIYSILIRKGVLILCDVRLRINSSVLCLLVLLTRQGLSVCTNVATSHGIILCNLLSHVTRVIQEV